MQKNEDEMLAEAYGLLARGYKKLRQIHLIRSRLSSPGRGSPQSSESDESSDTEIGTSGPDSENTTPPQSSLFPHIDFLCKTRSGAWGNAFLKHALDHCMAGKVRADRFKNFWVADPSFRSGWRSVGKTQFMDTFRTAATFVSSCQEVVGECTGLAQFEEGAQCKLRASKWKRRHNIVDAHFNYPTFLEFCREEHKRLPPLRGGAVRRGNKNCLK